MSAHAKVAVISTGGTISSVGRDPFDLQSYVTLGKMLDAEGMIGADTLNPQKARIVLSLALNRTSDKAEIRKMIKIC